VASLSPSVHLVLAFDKQTEYHWQEHKPGDKHTLISPENLQSCCGTSYILLDQSASKSPEIIL